MTIVSDFYASCFGEHNSGKILPIGQPKSTLLELKDIYDIISYTLPKATNCIK